MSGESDHVYALKRMEFASNFVVAKSPNFMDLGLLPAITTDKLKSVSCPATIVERLTDVSNWLAYRHGCDEFTVGRVSKAKAFSDYI